MEKDFVFIERLDKDGRVYLPKEIRKICGLEDDTHVAITSIENGIFIRPANVIKHENIHAALEEIIEKITQP